MPGANLGVARAIDAVVSEYGWDTVLSALQLCLIDHFHDWPQTRAKVCSVILELRELVAVRLPDAPGSHPDRSI